MNDKYFFNVLLILIVSGYVKSNISKSDVADTASIVDAVASTLDSLDNMRNRRRKNGTKISAQSGRHRRSDYPDEEKIKDYLISKQISLFFSNLFGTGVDYFLNNVPSKAIEHNKQKFEDLYMIEHDKTKLKYRVENDEVVIGDIVTCLMSNQETQHYGVVINSKGDIFNFGGETPIKTLITRVDGKWLL